MRGVCTLSCVLLRDPEKYPLKVLFPFRGDVFEPDSAPVHDSVPARQKDRMQHPSLHSDWAADEGRNGTDHERNGMLEPRSAQSEGKHLAGLVGEEGGQRFAEMNLRTRTRRSRNGHVRHHTSERAGP
jgi:hypothetical protein